MKLDLTSLKKAVNSLETALIISGRRIKGFPIDAEELVLRAGVIQNFEFTFELCWKFMQRSLEEQFGEDLEKRTRRDMYRIAAEKGLIDTELAWVGFHEARNKTAHIYDEDVAQEVFVKAKEFLEYAKTFLEKLEKIN